MQIINLYAELLANPHSLADYRKLVSHYKNCKQTNEASAIEDLIKRKFNADSSSTDEEQLEDNPKSN